MFRSSGIRDVKMFRGSPQAPGREWFFRIFISTKITGEGGGGEEVVEITIQVIFDVVFSLPCTRL